MAARGKPSRAGIRRSSAETMAGLMGGTLDAAGVEAYFDELQQGPLLLEARTKGAGVMSEQGTFKEILAAFLAGHVHGVQITVRRDGRLFVDTLIRQPDGRVKLASIEHD